MNRKTLDPSLQSTCGLPVFDGGHHVGWGHWGVVGGCGVAHGAVGAERSGAGAVLKAPGCKEGDGKSAGGGGRS